jgi:hypothetical protein
VFHILYNPTGSYNNSSTASSYDRKTDSRTWAAWLGLS